MFPRRKRFPRASFPAALSGGRRFASAHFSIILPKEASGYAVVISKKTARLASARHRIKRRVLAALRSLPLPSSLLVFPRSSVQNMPYRQVRDELSDLLTTVDRRHAST